MTKAGIHQGEPLLTPGEVAALFKVNVKSVTRWAKAGKLTSVRTLGGHRRYKEAEVRALLAPAPEAPADPLDAPVAHLWQYGDLDTGTRKLLSACGTLRGVTRLSAADLREAGLSEARVDAVRLALYRKGLALHGDILGEVA